MNWSAFVLPGILIVSGAAIYNFGSQYPQYFDSTAAAQLRDPRWLERVDEKYSVEDWFALRTSLLTPRDHFHDRGLSVILLGIGVGAIFLLQRVDGLRGIVRMRTPTSQRNFCALAAITWISFIPAVTSYFIYTEQRGDYSPLADTIAIPIAGGVIVTLLLFPIVILGTWTATCGRTLPQRIWSRQTWLHVGPLDVLILLTLVPAGMILKFGMMTMPPIVPPAVFAIYLLLSGKAAAASARQHAL